MSTTLEFYGPNAGYVEELYERYRQDPASVDAETRALFEQGFAPPQDTVTLTPADPPAVPDGNGIASIAQGVAPQIEVTKIVAAARLARIVRELGHLDARLDPLGSEPPSDPSLTLEAHGLTTDDLLALPASVVGGPLAKGTANALAALAKLRRAYSGSVGYEDDHIQVAEEREWLRESIETGRFFQNFGPTEKRDLLERLTAVDTFEQFLQKTPPFQGQKRFSVEGLDIMVPMLDAIIRCAAQAGTREVVMGMAHRGRLNVLAHILNKPYEAILAEFPNPNAPTQQASVSGSGALGYTGDVKYHKGYVRKYQDDGSSAMPITLAPNPSHLEFVDPAVVGRARAAQETRDHAGAPAQDPKASLAILIHGDAAFPGQGVVAETLNLTQLKGYRVGGVIHIIANNQIGFTTNPGDARSTLYASDLAKGFEMPIVHVNADDAEACIAVSRMACAYRDRFGKDFLIDLVGYRRLGHNETDEPAFTQPRMYEKIRSRPRPREVWAAELDRQHIVSKDEADAMVKKAQARLMEAKNAASLAQSTRNPDAPAFPEEPAPWTSAVSEERLRRYNDLLTTLPDGFSAHANIGRTILTTRREALDKPGAIVWGHAEGLAFASILEDGTPIRLTGQDSERGTFSHRHVVLNDPTNGARFCPLQRQDSGLKASFAVFNSPLSETAALGFEYGYSVHATNTLVLWEAQFGDFVNGAQVIIDQFIASGNAKWGQSPSVVLLLPHGYEGQGPEHSSGRLERFLQLCAGDNMRVVNLTTAAQYFHLLRRQAFQLENEPRPLVVMTPKSLLRHPRASSSLGDLTQGEFRPVLDDPRDPAHKAGVSRLVLCSGKVYVDLVYGDAKSGFAERPEYVENDRLAIARIEELNPFPSEELSALLAAYPNVREVVWTQEEPRNMGAWSFVREKIAALLPDTIALRYNGRPESSSPSEGSITAHEAEQSRIVREALTVDAPASGSKNGLNGHGNGGGGMKNGAGTTATNKQKKSRTEESSHAR
jgi:2-oxoglutarate dehydrogenase E1 component